uniref:Carboxylesterase type B domain-containing protein n=1 Tax=Romanomermis culicivorax TaxID=13658 RepID=A0A915HKS6_ROMCU
MDLLTGTTKYEDGPQKWIVKRGSPLTTIRKCSQIVQQNENLKRKKRITTACIREYVSGIRPWEIFSRNRTADMFSFWTDQTVAVQEDAEYFAPCAEEVASMLNASKGVDTKKSKLKGIYPWHAADVSFVLGSHKLDGKFDEKDLEIQKRYLPLFVNFIKFGDPTRTPVDGVRIPVLDIKNSKRPYPYLSVNIPVKVEKAYHQKADDFWNVIVPRLENKKGFWPESKHWLYPINSDGSIMENFTWSELIRNVTEKRDVRNSNGSQY